VRHLVSSKESFERGTKMKEKVRKKDEEWREQLTDDEYRVTRR